MLRSGVPRAASPRRPAETRLAAAVGGALVLATALGAVAAKSWWTTAPPRFKALTFRAGTVSSARFSPDGQTIAYSAASDGGPLELYTQNTGQNESRAFGLQHARVLSISRSGEVAVQLLAADTLLGIYRSPRHPRESPARRRHAPQVARADGERGLVSRRQRARRLTLGQGEVPSGIPSRPGSLRIGATDSDRPRLAVAGFAVEEMVKRPNAFELLAGVGNDRTFGPILLFGHGGTGAEVIADRAIGLPPLNIVLARAMITRTRIYKLLRGYRDRPPAAIDEIALTLIRLSRLLVDMPEVVELDINPLIADEQGVLALDARVVLLGRAGQSRTGWRSSPIRAN